MFCLFKKKLYLCRAKQQTSVLVMTQEQKDLLLKDLCARLPYGVKGNFLNEDKTPSNDKLLREITITYHHLVTASGHDGMVLKGDIKPYLIPLSSMTEEQSKIYHELIGGMFGTNSLICFEALEDFFHKNHLDCRGLIPNDLAIDATGLNVYKIKVRNEIKWIRL